MNESIPKTLDWVTARAECSLEHSFILLREVVGSDVKVMSEKTPDKISINQMEHKFIVVRMRDIGGGFSDGRGVVFELERDALVVRATSARGPEKELFRARPILTPGGECRLAVGEDVDTPLELWQVSRKALENLFFPVQ